MNADEITTKITIHVRNFFIDITTIRTTEYHIFGMKGYYYSPQYCYLFEIVFFWIPC